MNFIWYDPWLTCTLAVEDQIIRFTFPIKPSVHNNQDIFISIEEIQRNSALVRRLINSFHCTRSQRIHRDTLCSCALYSSRNSLLREIICRILSNTVPMHRKMYNEYVCRSTNQRANVNSTHTSTYVLSNIRCIRMQHFVMSGFPLREGES